MLPIVRGFRFAGISAGIKKKQGVLDLGLIQADEPCSTAVVLTKNLVRAAPVEITQTRARKGKAQAIVVNSGCANACTGIKGEKAALESTNAVARALGIDEKLILPASTGVIGQVLPSEKIVKHVAKLVKDLSDDGASRFATAILTTDKSSKTAYREIKIGKRAFTILGIAKGAGMIHPNMATTLAFVLTDAPVKVSFLKKTLREATNASFNCISVDGDTSTNDTIVLMASGAEKGKKLEGKGSLSHAFEKGVAEVLESLGRMIVADGEGAEHIVRINVEGATRNKEAKKIASTIATSPLVKTAIHGCDPNWGRIIAAAGRSGVRFDPNQSRILIGDVMVFDKGIPVQDAEVDARANRVMKQPEYEIHVIVGKGQGKAHYDACDLGHSYISINADYRS